MVTGIKTKIFFFYLVLFSKELFSDTRLSQLPTGGVQLHIEDWQAGVQRSSWEKKLLKMRNEPNFKRSGQPVTLDMTRTYNDNQPEKRRKKRTQNGIKMNKNRAKIEKKRTKTNEKLLINTP